MSLLALPSEILLGILSLLSVPDLLRAELVCRQLQSAIQLAFLSVYGPGPAHRLGASPRTLAIEQYKTKVWSVCMPADQLNKLLYGRYLDQDTVHCSLAIEVLLILRQSRTDGDDWAEATAAALMAQKRYTEARMLYKARKGPLSERSILVAARWGWPFDDILLPRSVSTNTVERACLGAAVGGNITLLTHLYGEDIYALGDPLGELAQRGKEDAVSVLLCMERVSCSLKDTFGRTALSRAVSGGHEATVRHLLHSDRVDPESRDDCGRTPLSWAAALGYHAIVDLLVRTGRCDVNSRDVSGHTPLSWATTNDHMVTAWTLIQSDSIDLNFRDSDGWTPLAWAVAEGRNRVVKLLLESPDVLIDSKDDQGQTPLSLAAMGGEYKCVALLLASRAVKVDSQDHSGLTPLSWASMMGHEGIVKRLLATEEAGTSLKDSQGRTALSHAAASGYDAIVTLLLRHD